MEKQNHVGSVRKSKNKQTGGAQTFVRTQKCLAQFAGEIAQLQNKNLKDVVMSNQAKMQSQRGATPTILGHAKDLLVPVRERERDVLEDGEFVLSDRQAQKEGYGQTSKKIKLRLNT